MALVFVTNGGPRDELRRRARRFGDDYDTDLATQARTLRRIEQTPLPFPSTVSYHREAGGIRLEIRASYPTDVEALRDHLRARATAMRATKTCASSPSPRSKR
jgi:hypothetical protein